jgi:hypothetical protein
VTWLQEQQSLIEAGVGVEQQEGLVVPGVVVGNKCRPRYKEHIDDDNKAPLHIALEHWDTQGIAGKGVEHPMVLQMIVHLL